MISPNDPNVARMPPDPVARRKRILLAVLIGMVAFVLNLAYLRQGDRVTVLRVISPAAVGTVLREDVHLQAFTIIGEDLETMRKTFVTSDVKGVFLQMPLAEAIAPGQLLTQRAFRLEGQTRLNLKDGERAVSFRVRDDSAPIVCFIGPDSLIDVWAQVKQGEPTLVIRNARVLALGDAVAVARPNQCQDSRYFSLTVAVAEAEVKPVLQSLDLARQDIRITVPPAAAAAAVPATAAR
jgi:hypothetical protein